jgi:primosomal protein N' (replication factor Y)
MRYCRVIVDLAADDVDRLFTYRVPEGMALSPGQRVAVPFGPRRLEGWVIALTDEADIEEEKIRPVLRPLEDYPLLLSEMIDLAAWLKDTCHSTMAAALRLMIPSQLRGDRVREKTVRTARLLIEGPAVAEAIAARARAKRQAEALRGLADGPRPASDFDRAALKALEKAGLVEVCAVEALRTPYRASDGGHALPPRLTPAQKRAEARITAAMDDGGGRFLLLGVTGSGKTEVYIRAVKHALASGKTAIVLVPEIALTPQMVYWFRARFGADAAVMHSALSPGERYDEWRRLRTGRAKVAIGPRSAVFAPLENLGLIVVDEEHEHTYQSDRHPCYDARDVARHRCAQGGAVLVLGSATPSIASFMRTRPGVRPENALELIDLPDRIPGSRLPDVEIVDMSREFSLGNRSIFSARLQDALSDCLARGHQAILFINRRGYATFVSCRACGHVEKCAACDVSMTYHQSDALMRCHYCGAVRRPPEKCPACGSPSIRYFGAGTQKGAEEAQKLFLDARILRMDMDTTRGRDAHEKLLSAFRRGEADILIGTQMIAKGLDFPNVTLVGVVAADMALNLPDYRSAERTFQLITQVSGRAGRAQSPGLVIVQTYQPENYAIRLAARQDYRAFYEQESRLRRRALYPPFTLLTRLLVTAKDEAAARETAEALDAELARWLEETGLEKGVLYRHAREAAIRLIRGRARWQVFLKLFVPGPADEILEKMRSLSLNPPEGVTVELEINPSNMI